MLAPTFLVLAFASYAAAQASPYGQCGGIVSNKYHFRNVELTFDVAGMDRPDDMCCWHDMRQE